MVFEVNVDPLKVPSVVSSSFQVAMDETSVPSFSVATYTCDCAGPPNGRSSVTSEGMMLKSPPASASGLIPMSSVPLRSPLPPLPSSLHEQPCPQVAAIRNKIHP